MSQVRILIAEDDEHIRGGLADMIESEGWEAETAADGTEALAKALRGGFDLVMLDVMMPGKSGYDVCRELRAQDSHTPILMLTAKGEEIDKVVGLRLGADDYLTKPFGIHELLARIQALLRRAKLAESPREPDRIVPFRFAELEVDPSRMTGQGRQLEVHFTERELHLMRCFASAPGRVWRRDELLEEVWGMAYQGTTRTLDQHIAQLRKKVEPCPSAPRFITTVHGVGYQYHE